jgi:hypothetical protein
MSAKFKSTWFFAELESYDKGRKESQRSVNYVDFANRLQAIYESFDNEGYDVIQVVPVAGGTSEQCANRRGDYLGDVGFSITRGAVVMGRKREP